MNVFLFILIGLCLAGMKSAPEGKFYSEYAAPEQADVIKGICVLLVFFSHIRGYVNFDISYNEIYLKTQGYLGQMIVVPFLFYSGYGMTLSIEKKGLDYVKTIPTQRILRILFHFDIAVILFAIVNVLLGNELTWKSVILALTSWESIGNSNWYITAILLSYLATFVAFRIFGKNGEGAAVGLSILMVMIVAIISKYHPDYCSNTMFAYVLGVWVAIFKDRIDSMVQKNDLIYIGILAVCIFVYYLVHKRCSENIWWYNLWAVMFMLILLLLLMKIRIESECLKFFGRHIFSIYILQRIPMWIMARRYHVDHVPYKYFLSSFIITIFMALIFDKMIEQIDKNLFKKHKK